MLSYDLAKKLKEAGFPQGYYESEKNEYYFREGKLIIQGGIHLRKIGYSELFKQVIEYEKELTLVPTLSELIDACGDDFLGVNRTQGCAVEEFNKWEAIEKVWCCNEHGESRKYGYGANPEESVANLWLELHKNS